MALLDLWVLLWGTISNPNAPANPREWISGSAWAPIEPRHSLSITQQPPTFID
jgi:hypothetical protein